MKLGKGKKKRSVNQSSGRERKTIWTLAPDSTEDRACARGNELWVSGTDSTSFLQKGSPESGFRTKTHFKQKNVLSQLLVGALNWKLFQERSTFLVFCFFHFIHQTLDANSSKPKETIHITCVIHFYQRESGLNENECFLQVFNSHSFYCSEYFMSALMNFQV